ncbi:non-ribosomal peptide synthetase [Sorangium cellulosum]|uniref:Non-ribosomal peptide synthetase n=1 Tax=Sorangium cellulosum TaxID=56 RepID=A0A150QFK2_SORCE|nr:non-ribosomal peptide synthetase [Sorangium cellulosum]KYF66721.1 non-ribosomal peptide synthetase [Sorangium cellulosum]
MTNKKKDVESIHYLSPLQQGLLFHAVSDRSADPYFVQAAFLLEGRLDLDAFERAWQALAERHPILRTAFVWEGVAKPVQVVRPRVTIPVARHDLRGLAAGEREEALSALMAADRRAGFDLLKAPLMRLTVVQAEDDAFYFINSHHHLLLDGWSFALLLREALLVYRSLARGTTPELPRPRPYREYLSWVQAQDEGAAERFFRGALAGFRAPTPLPMEAGPAAGAAGGDAFPCAEQALRFSRAETEALAACARRLRVTLNTLVQGAWALLLSRHSGEPDVVFGATVSGRPPELPGSEAIVGVLINTLPVRVRVDEHEPLAAWLSRLQDRNSELRQHEWAPLSLVQRWSDVPGGRSLFDSLVVFDSYPEEEVPDAQSDVRDVRVRALPRPGGGRVGDALLTDGRNNYPVSLIVEPSSELGLILSYERRRLTHEAAASLLGQCRALLEAMAARPRARLAELPLVGAAERRRLLTDMNATATASAPSACVHELFEAHAAARPDALAVVCEETALTYGELDRRTNQLARRLRALGVRPEDRVVVCIERSAEMVVALLGALKAGAAYVPVDPKFPRERLRAVVEDSGARAVITQERWAGAFDGPGPALLLLDRDAGALAAEPDAPLLGQTARTDNLAYLIYTSGSTGRPKGVAVEHRHLASYVRGVLARLPLAEGGGMALVSTVAADLGHTSLFGALCSGRALHVLSEARIFDPDATAEYMSRHRVDALKIVPSHLGALLEAAQPENVLPTRCLVLGGEASSWELIERIRKLAPGCTVVNHYGPTETTVGSLTWQVDPAAGRSGATVPIGRPLPNTQAYVLGVNFEPLPVGVPGELYLGGAGVARGYHARPELTAERFVPDPFGGVPGGRLYRTGDRARVLASGAIEFLGRTDHQIKLRGHRVELGEIEARLREQPEVREAVVAARDGGGALRLVAYVVAREAAALDAAALRGRLAQQLPETMVPAVIVPLPALPLTANGKIDRAALPEPGRAGAPEAGGFVAPRNEVEATLARIWADILRVERVGIHDNFFALGGDSIRSLQVIARANQRGVKLSPKDLFDHPTVAAAAAVAVSSAPASTAGAAPVAPGAAPDQAGAPQADRPGATPPRFSLSGLTDDEIARHLPDPSGLDDVYPLSPMQEGMLFHTLLNPGSGIYLMQQHYVWHGALDPDLVVEAWRRVAARHPILRTSFVWKDLERPLQIVHREVDLSDVIRFLDWRDRTEAEQERRLAEVLESELAEGLDMTRPPLLRIRLIRVRDDAYRIVRSFHHILTDDWCFSVLMMECLSYYAALREGRPLELPEPRPYRDYIAWLARQDLPAAERFWREELRGFTEPTPLGVDRILPDGAAPPAGAGVSDAFVELPPALTEALLGLAHQHGLTPNTFVQGAWALLLSRYSGRRDVVFGVTVAGRPTDLPGVETIVGLFINSLPLRVRVPPEQPLVPWLKGLLAHNYRIREVEYPPLVEIQRWSELPRGQALFGSLVVFENAPKDPRLGEQVGDVHLSYEQDRVHTNYPMTVVAYPSAGLGIRLSYDRRLFDHDAVERMLGHLVELLSEMARRPEARLGDLSPLGERERRQLLLEWNDTKGAEPAAPGYVALFEAQARKTPDAVAVTCRERRLTYAALNRAANHVAHALRAQGVGPDTIVAVLESRDIELVVAVLGVLKAGGAYLPLDPHQPEQRIAGVVEASRAPVVVTSEAWVPRLARALAHLPEPARPRFVTRERLAAQRGPAPVDDPPRRAGPGHLAYVITTSGSTGVPKGAMVEHAGMLNNVWGKIPALELGPSDVIGQTASQCFDISVWQLLTALLCGGRVHIVPEEIVGDPRRLVEEAEAQGITVLELVPSLLGELVSADADAPRLSRLRWMLPTGEALTPDLCRRWFARYPRVPLMNAYGPAECADDVALHAITEAPGPEVVHVPIGRPVPNVRLHVVTGDDLAPVGVTGEICVAGVGVGRGYLNDPARTAEAFVPDPFGGAPGARMYRTGDLGRRLADGTLEFSGRRDHQVKIRGFRIELGEIEARLAQHPEVREAVVAVREERASGKRLVAYVVGEDGAAPAPERLREFLKETLPDYMVPPVFVALPALPLTPNGKVDRKALPAPEAPAVDAGGAAGGAPTTPTEEALAGIWAEVLGLEQVPVHAGFFELGGHSLLATQVVSRVRKALGVELPLRSLFDHPTVAELARDVDRRRGPAGGAPAAGPPPLVPVPRGGPLPLSFAQQRLWFLAQLEPDSAGYNMTAAVRVEGELDVALLRESLVALVRRHESLRTTFGVAAGEPVQVIAPDAAPEFEVVDLSATPAGERGAAIQRLAADRAERPFDLGRGPLLRVTAIRLRDDELVLVVVVHHIVADGWTMNVLVAELAELYAAARAGRPPALRPLPVQYADFAVWQRRWIQGATREALLGAWRERLAGPPPALDLRPDHPRSGASSYSGGRHTIAVDSALSEALRALGRREGATLFMTLLAAFQIVLLGRSGQTDILVGTDVAGRSRAETEGLIGFFVNLLVLRTDLGGLPTFRELLRRVREVTLDAYAHQDLPFEQVVDAVKPAREPGRHPLVQALFVLQNVPASEISLPGVRFSAVELDREVSRFDLGVFVDEGDEGLTCAWKYRADLFEPPTIAAMAAHFMAVLRAIVDDPDRRVTALAAAERKERTMEGRARDEGRLRSLKRIAPRKVDVGPSALVATGTLGDGPLPLVVRPAVDDVDLAAWAREERAFVEAQLLRHGAVLFRGFPIRKVQEFEQVAQAVCGELFGEYGDLPREKTGQHIYSSTPYPADKAILFHNESSHLPRWPLKQWFFCVQAAPEGGATPIVDCRRLYDALAPDVRERFRRSGLLYVRNFTPGFDVGWQDFFHTTDPAVVEERCRAGGMRCAWLAGGRLRISQRGPAVLAHPKTGEPVFFNQIQLHHPAYLEAPVRESLLAMVGEEWLPRNVTYGDGAPIEVETTRALGEAYERCAVRFPWQEGDIILLDNMLVAHGRDPFSGPRKIVVAMGEMMTAERAAQAARASDGAVAS